jgi:hypothetical protein
VRRAGVDELIKKLKKLVEASPDSFNIDAVADPKYRGNRFILLGDSNMSNHQCSEINETLVKLRREFGYAVEVSMAQLDWYNRTLDLHYSGAPITDPNQGKYGDCSDASWAHPRPGSHGSATGCPYRYEHVSAWKSEPSAPAPGNPSIETGQKYAVDPSQWYPWWGGTSSGGGGGSRLDVIILVGRGWAYDDPLLRYTPVSDVNFVSHANDYTGGGAEIMKPDEAAWNDWNPECKMEGSPNLVTVPGSYSPSFALISAPDGEGAPFVCTDHKPIGARLRLTFAR